MIYEIDIYSDVICPWCYIGKRRLEQAVRSLRAGDQTRVTWRAFELNPEMPAEGMERRVYRAAKFGNETQSQAKDQQVTQLGASEGIRFAFDRIARTPNTVSAHRLVWLAGHEGAQDAVVERLFQAYFIEARDIGDRDVLTAAASAAGLDSGMIRAFLESDTGITEVRAEEAMAHRLGINSVPAFIVNGRYAISGAQPSEALAGALREITAEAAEAGCPGSGVGASG
jgi:predicted DsbA family dithiol-disulfide isomerase